MTKDQIRKENLITKPAGIQINICLPLLTDHYNRRRNVFLPHESMDLTQEQVKGNWNMYAEGDSSETGTELILHREKILGSALATEKVEILNK